MNIDHSIGDFNSQPSSSQAVFVQLDKVDINKVRDHLNASSPIIFLVPNYPVDTNELEELLLEENHKAPVYFSYSGESIPKSFKHVISTSTSSNSIQKRAKLQNVIGTINGSKTFEQERLALITAPFDTFSTVPAAQIGANNNAIALSAMLEVMRLVSRFPITNNWAFVFAMTDGSFCKNEGLERAVKSLNSIHGAKVEFAISLDSISSPKLTGVYGQKLRRDSSFAKFMFCLLDSMRSAGIQFNTTLDSESEKSAPFIQHIIPSIVIQNEDGQGYAHITDSQPNIDRSNAMAWALAEALLRMMYDADSTAVMIDRNTIDTSTWANILGSMPRMPFNRDANVVSSIAQWMKKFSVISTDDWTTSNCYAPYSNTQATLVLYNPTPFTLSLVLYVAAFVYGFLVFILMGGYEKIKPLLNKSE